MVVVDTPPGPVAETYSDEVVHVKVLPHASGPAQISPGASVISVPEIGVEHDGAIGSAVLPSAAALLHGSEAGG